MLLILGSVDLVFITLTLVAIFYIFLRFIHLKEVRKKFIILFYVISAVLILCWGLTVLFRLINPDY